MSEEELLAWFVSRMAWTDQAHSTGDERWMRSFWSEDFTRSSHRLYGAAEELKSAAEAIEANRANMEVMPNRHGEILEVRAVGDSGAVVRALVRLSDDLGNEVVTLRLGRLEHGRMVTVTVYEGDEDPAVVAAEMDRLANL